MVLPKSDPKVSIKKRTAKETGRKLHDAGKAVSNCPFSYSLPPSGYSLYLRGRVQNVWHSSSSPKIGEVAAKQTEEYDSIPIRLPSRSPPTPLRIPQH